MIHRPCDYEGAKKVHVARSSLPNKPSSLSSVAPITQVVLPNHLTQAVISHGRGPLVHVALFLSPPPRFFKARSTWRGDYTWAHHRANGLQPFFVQHHNLQPNDRLSAPPNDLAAMPPTALQRQKAVSGAIPAGKGRAGGRIDNR